MIHLNSISFHLAIKNNNRAIKRKANSTTIEKTAKSFEIQYKLNNGKSAVLNAIWQQKKTIQHYLHRKKSNTISIW